MVECLHPPQQQLMRNLQEKCMYLVLLLLLLISGVLPHMG